MADRNSLVLDVAAYLPPGEWEAATDRRRVAYLSAVADLAAGAKRRQIRIGRGADGKPLAKVQPQSRPDGATGKPLDPHYGESRSVKWLRASKGRRTVTLWWSHGFGKILGWHARGEVRYAPVRDVIGFDAAAEKKLKADARTIWAAGARHDPATTRRELPRPAPEPQPVPMPQPPTIRRVPARAPIELPPGARPDPRSRRIQFIRGVP